MPARAPDQRVDADREAERLRVAAAQQDPGLFAPLYEAHFDVVYAYVARRVAERAEAEDLTSEVFRKALDGLGAFEWRGLWHRSIATPSMTALYITPLTGSEHSWAEDPRIA